MRRTIVVIEGPDGTGKTTLANALVERLGFEYDHCGPPEKPALQFYMDSINRHDGDTVIDRLHVGSYVYGKAFRGLDDLTDFERWLLEGVLRAHNGLLIYTKLPQEVVEANLARGPDSNDAVIYEAADKRLAVRQLYAEYMATVNQLPQCTYDFTEVSLDDAVDIVRALQERPRVDWLAPYVPALGNLVDPSLILVGDEPHSRQKALQRFRKVGLSDARVARAIRLLARSARFTAPFNSPSGRYLHLALTASKLSPGSYCVLNSIQLDGRPLSTFADVRYLSGHGSVVALGRNAAERLKFWSIPHRVVPHPQHWKRFHYKDVFTYAKMLTGEVLWTGCRLGDPCLPPRVLGGE